MTRDEERLSAVGVTEETAGLSAEGDVYDCLRCGACCHGDAMWVHLVASDDARMDERTLVRLTVLTEHGRGYVARSMRMVAGRCAALSEHDGLCKCSIYEMRPDVCRAFEPGSSDCRAARRHLVVGGQSARARQAP